MRGTRVAPAAAFAALLAPASAGAAPPVITAHPLSYGSSGTSSIVSSVTLNEGVAEYFEIWLNQQTGQPTNVQFESNPPGINGNCSGGVQQGRAFMACMPTPNATPGTTMTVTGTLPETVQENSGGLVTVISPPGGPANTTSVPVSGPINVAEPPPALDIERLRLNRENRLLKARMLSDEGAEIIVEAFFFFEAGFPEFRLGATPSQRKKFELKPATATVEANVPATLKLRVPMKGRDALAETAEAGKKVKAVVTATATNAAGNTTEVTEKAKLKPKK
jgi:hypothetical protein